MITDTPYANGFLEKLNSMTKYPSILTYHKMGEKGCLLDEVQVDLRTDLSKDVVTARRSVTEKVDGTNGRIVVCHHPTRGRRFFIGSREELLYAQGDLLHNPALGIVDALLPLCERIKIVEPEVVQAFYFEVFGGRFPASKQYTKSGKVSVRMFDVTTIGAPLVMKLCEKPIGEIASWRDNNGQLFHNEQQLALDAEWLGVQLTPRVDAVAADTIPASIAETYEFLQGYKESRCNIDCDAFGKSEGVVIRASDRWVIAKFRFEDYERTLRKRK